MDKKIKVLTLSDNPLFFSGIGTQTKYFCEALLETGRFEIFSIAGQAVPVTDPRIIEIDGEGNGGTWHAMPVHGYGNRELLQSIMRKFRPDIIWFMTDPRFWDWLWHQDREIRPFVPLVYYHVWDNFPAPKFNRKYYESNDLIVNMSKPTQQMVEEVAPSVPSLYLPLTVDDKIFKKLPKEEVDAFVLSALPEHSKDKFKIFWNNRNGQRKLAGTLMEWYKEFSNKVGWGKTCLIMNTNPKDQVGIDIEEFMKDYDLLNGEVILSPNQVTTDILVKFYNCADVVCNISHSEGFGLGTLEALSCETPIIALKTGGLTEQVTDGVNTFGVALEPKVKIVTGGQDVPYIYQDYCLKEDFISALELMYSMPKEQRESIGKLGREHALKNFGFEDAKKKWVSVLEDVYRTNGSWETRKNYQAYNITKF